MIRNRGNAASIAGAMLLALATGGCAEQGDADGKTVASIDGVDISEAELKAEMAEARIPEDQRDRSKNIILQRIIERKLLAQAGSEAKIDEDPAFKAARQRADELMLAQAYLQRTADGLKHEPGAADIAAYRASHPALAGERQELALEQVQFQTPTDAAVLQPIERARTMPELIGLLKQRGIAFQPGQSRVDTATAPEDVSKALLALRPGEPLVMTGGPVVTASVIAARRTIDMTPEQADAVIRTRIVNERISEGMTKAQKALRDKAKISYAEGYGATDTIKAPK